MPPRAQQDLRPPALRPGDLVAVPAPSGPVPREAFLKGLAILEARYRVVHAEDLFRADGYLAGSDARRAVELNRYLALPEVRAIFCARGGYGSLRIVPDLDPAPLAARPRTIVGFSDITVLHCWAHAAAGVRTVHGPVVTQLGELPDDDRAALWRLLEDPTPPGPWVSGLRAPVGGIARGRLLGGNLEVLSRLLGTPYFPDLTGAILFLEEVGERPYRLDRTLTGLHLAGVLDGVAGIVVGDLTACDEPNGSGPDAASVVEERLARLGVPLCFGLPVGHAHRNRALPVGAIATLDADAGVLSLEEGAVAAAA